MSYGSNNWWFAWESHYASNVIIGPILRFPPLLSPPLFSSFSSFSIRYGVGTWCNPSTRTALLFSFDCFSFIQKISWQRRTQPPATYSMTTKQVLLCHYYRRWCADQLLYIHHWLFSMILFWNTHNSFFIMELKFAVRFHLSKWMCYIKWKIDWDYWDWKRWSGTRFSSQDFIKFHNTNRLMNFVTSVWVALTFFNHSRQFYPVKKLIYPPLSSM